MLYLKRWFLAVVFLLLAFPFSALAESNVWEVVVVGLSERRASTTLVDFRDGKYWINQKDAAELGLDTIKLSNPNFGSEVNLSDYGTVTVLEQKAQVVLDIDMKYRQVTLIDLFGKTSNTMPPTRVLDSIFLNYDLRYQRQKTDTQEINSYSVFFDANANVGETRLNYQWQKSGQTNGDYTPWERVSANIIKDDLETAVTYLVGDSFSNAGVNANPVSFTGVQIAKDFGLQPGFITQSKLDINGVAARPSTLDIFIDNIKARTTNVPAGPFSVNNLIGLSGSGLARIVVKDDLGNEQVITGLLFGGTNLLAAGVSTFAIQAGLMRPDQNNWDGKMMSGYYRRGLTNWLTVEVNAEKANKTDLLDEVKHRGAALSVATPLGSVDVSKRVGTGTQTYLGYQKLWRVNNLSMSFNANQIKYSDDYQILGGATTTPYRRSAQMSLSYRRISGSFLVVNSPSDQIKTATVSYTMDSKMPVSIGLSLTSSLQKLTGDKDKTINLSISIPLGRTQDNRVRSASLNFSRDSTNKWSRSLQFQDSTFNPLGGSYQLNESKNTSNQSLGGNLVYQGRYGELGGALSLTKNQNDSSEGRSTAVQTYAKGSLVATEHDLMPAPWINDGFVLVDSGFPNVGIQVNNQVRSISNQKGKAIIGSGVYSLMRNVISLEGMTAPERYDGKELRVSPLRKSGTIAVFSYPTQAMVLIPNEISGSLLIGEELFPITDRGCFVELPEGEYVGILEDGRKVHFVMPKTTADQSFPTVIAEHLN